MAGHSTKLVCLGNGLGMSVTHLPALTASSVYSVAELQSLILFNVTVGYERYMMTMINELNTL
jgi:hypothetical protein